MKQVIFLISNTTIVVLFAMWAIPYLYIKYKKGVEEYKREEALKNDPEHQAKLKADEEWRKKRLEEWEKKREIAMKTRLARCSYCYEEIQWGALICPHCNRNASIKL